MPHTAEKADPESVYFRHINPQWVRLLSLLQMNCKLQPLLGSGSRGTAAPLLETHRYSRWRGIARLVRAGGWLNLGWQLLRA